MPIENSVHIKGKRNVKRYYKIEHTYMKTADTAFVNLIINEFIQRGAVSKKDRIMEIGSGYGRFSIPIIERGYKIILSDVVDEILEKSKKNLENKGMKNKIVYFDVLDSNKNSGNKFDIICGFHVLHHIDDLEKAFTNMYSNLSDTGKIIFVEPNPINPLYYIQILIIKEMQWKEERGILDMRNSYLLPLLKRCGFKKIEISKFGFFPNFLVNTKLGTSAEKVVNRIRYNPFGLYKLIIARKD